MVEMKMMHTRFTKANNHRVSFNLFILILFSRAIYTQTWTEQSNSENFGN